MENVAVLGQVRNQIGTSSCKKLRAISAMTNRTLVGSQITMYQTPSIVTTIKDTSHKKVNILFGIAQNLGQDLFPLSHTRCILCDIITNELFASMFLQQHVH